MPHRLTRDKKVVRSDGFPCSFQFGPDIPRNLRVAVIEGKNRNGASQQSLNTLGISSGSGALVHPVPQLEQYDCGDIDGFSGSENGFKPVTDACRVAIQQSNARIRIQQVAHSNTVRIGVRGWLRSLVVKSVSSHSSIWENHSFTSAIIG